MTLCESESSYVLVALADTLFSIIRKKEYRLISDTATKTIYRKAKSPVCRVVDSGNWKKVNAMIKIAFIIFIIVCAIKNFMKR